MHIHDATETAYKNGYERGKQDALIEDRTCGDCALDYHAEYDRKCAELEQAQAEVNFLRAELKATEAEFAKMRAQLDIVNLIFGGPNR